jgi:proteasome lid subunit RPN8/RPN11
LPRKLYEEMVSQARAELPNECCGLLAGRLALGSEQWAVGRVERRYPLVNELASTTEYYSAPFAAYKDMRREGLELLAIYHSHPTSDPVPSRKDIERNFYGATVVHFIISLKDKEPLMRGWRLNETSYVQAEWELTDEG